MKENRIELGIFLYLLALICLTLYIIHNEKTTRQKVEAKVEHIIQENKLLKEELENMQVDLKIYENNDKLLKELHRLTR